jgi:hypothetical protein
VVRFLEMPSHWEQYSCCLVMHVALPFLPLGLEWIFSGSIEEKSVLLFVAMYAMAIGITSSSLLALFLTLIVGLVYCAGFGFVSSGKSATVLGGTVAMVVLGAIVIIHAFERFNRHVTDRSPFWEFSKGQGQKANKSTVAPAFLDTAESE